MTRAERPGRRTRHLSMRFWRAARGGRPSRDDIDWVESVLDSDAFDLWTRQPAYDQRHTIRVARRVESDLAGSEFEGDARWLACALLHDIGKLDARLGVYGRVVATLADAAARQDMAEAWSARSGFTRRVGLYLRHPELGAVRLRLVGAPEEAARWAELHHTAERPADLGIPPTVVAALEAGDDD